MSNPSEQESPVFVTGSTMRHVAVMTGTASVGLVAIFLVDFLSLLYISWLGRPEATAGVGYATIILFFTISVNVGLMIGISALASRAIGAGDRPLARRFIASALVLMALTGGGLVLLAWPFLSSLLSLLGAAGEAHAIALRFLHITLPVNVLMAFSMGQSGALRAVGDAKRAMYISLTGGVTTAILDPLLIFGAGWGADGAAIATVISRLVFVAVGLHAVLRVHDLIARPTLADIRTHALPLFRIAGPAILTNIATPIANGVVAAIMSRFGDKVIAALAIIDRLTPVAFGVLFAMSGAVGPILGQNWGAKRFERMRQTLIDALILTTVYVALVSALLILGRHNLVALFHASEAGADLLVLYTWLAGPMWLFIGALFVANASFNNLGFPLYSTAFNWGRATLGTMPLGWAGATLDGARGVMLGVMVGAAIFGLWALRTSFHTVQSLQARAKV